MTMKKMLTWLVVIAIVAGCGYWVYTKYCAAPAEQECANTECVEQAPAEEAVVEADSCAVEAPAEAPAETPAE